MPTKVTKLAIKACRQSLKTLGLEYVDLYLIIGPAKIENESWRALVELQKDGLLSLNWRLAILL